MRDYNRAFKVKAVLVSRRQYLTLLSFMQLYCVACVSASARQAVEESDVVYDR